MKQRNGKEYVFTLIRARREEESIKESRKLYRTNL